MKKIVSIVALMAATVTAANAAPSHIARDGRGGYNVTYDYTDKAKTGWYVAGHLGLSLLNFDNKYSTDDAFVGNADYGRDEYSLEPVFDGSIAFGRRFNYFWRAELEGGYMGQFHDADAAADFTLNIPYVMLNGYYDFNSGLYLGAGAGIAIPVTTIDGIYFEDKDTKTSVSPMVGLMIGYSHKLDQNLVLDLRYRIAGTWGHTQRVDFQDTANAWHWLESENEMILDNSISVGLRYEF